MKLIYSSKDRSLCAFLQLIPWAKPGTSASITIEQSVGLVQVKYMTFCMYGFFLVFERDVFVSVKLWLWR